MTRDCSGWIMICPKCEGEEVERRHGWAYGIETSYWECETCEHQWGHE